MKKFALLVISIFFLNGCTLFKGTSVPKPCNENLEFRRDFFYHISVVEKYTVEHETMPIYSSDNFVPEKKFCDSYDFLYRVTKVKPGDILNYQLGYVGYEPFKLDKKKWLKWYDINKCNYLK